MTTRAFINIRQPWIHVYAYKYKVEEESSLSSVSIQQYIIHVPVLHKLQNKLGQVLGDNPILSNPIGQTLAKIEPI